MESIEDLQSRRNRLLMMTALLFLLWQGGTLVAELLQPGQPLLPFMLLAATCGGIGWIVVGIATVFYGRRIASARAAGVLNDERTEDNKNRATRFAYVSMIVVIALLFAASILTDMPAQPVIRAMLIVAVVAPLLSFVWYERHDLVNADGE